MENEVATFNAELDDLPSILSWVRDQLTHVSLSDKEKGRVELALEEAIVNVIEHGAKNSTFTLIVRYEPHRQVEFEIQDSGPPFNPLLHPISDRSELTIEEQPIGGLGLTFIRQCMDALFYRRENDQNILTLVKNTE